MKNLVPNLFILMFFVINLNSSAQITDILNFPASQSLSCSSGTVIYQPFIMPAGSNYDLTQIGIQIDVASQNNRLFFGLYNSSGNLLFRSNEVVYTAGSDKALASVNPGTITLKAGESYFAVMIFSGVNNLTIKYTSTVVNSGIATGIENTIFNTSNIYPNLPDPRAVHGGWGFSAGFLLKGKLLTTPIVPKDEILDFNCTNYLELLSGTIFFNYFTMPVGTNHELRQFGLKTAVCNPNGSVKFALYNNAFGLLAVTNEVSVSGIKPDTVYASIPSNTVILEPGKSYYIAMQYSGTNGLLAMQTKSPVSKGIALISDPTVFSFGHTYPTFPNPIRIDGGWALSLGFVLNGDTPVTTSVESNKEFKHEKIRAFPTVTDDIVWLYAVEPFTDNAIVDVYDINGKKTKSFDWKTYDRAITLNLLGLSSGYFIIKISGLSFESQTIKILKK